MRFVNDNNSPMVGMLVIENGYPKQLRAPSGPLIWISPILLTNFTFYLKEYVRMADAHDTRLLLIFDKSELTEDDALEILDISLANCNFFTDWSALPRDSTTLRVVPTSEAEIKLVADHPDKRFCQGQPCVLKKVPRPGKITISLYVAPPCVRELPPVNSLGLRVIPLANYPL